MANATVRPLKRLVLISEGLSFSEYNFSSPITDNSGITYGMPQIRRYFYACTGIAGLGNYS
ncbi:MAG TPA: hypothetical protein VD810_02695 [Methylophilaceae bacterium]|nr:hypothetical protein [Methylophilaceae bacterium]